MQNMEKAESYGKFIISNDLKEYPEISESQLNAIAARISDSIRDSEAKIKAELEKGQSK